MRRLVWAFDGRTYHIVGNLPWLIFIRKWNCNGVFVFSGYFEFRLCEHNSINTRAQQSCFDNGILLTVHGTGTSRYDVSEMKQRDYYFQLDMPNEVTCAQCILQWKYNAGMFSNNKATILQNGKNRTQKYMYQVIAMMSAKWNENRC